MGKISVTSLKDTIPYMMSNDYKERFKGEYYQLVIRIRNLEKTIRTRGNGMTISSLAALSNQLDSMLTYKAMLENRAKIQHIEL